ncbi:SIMPL domain-containing protein [Gehongia tenuis]|uniref:SIMPL domain-containing protein n=1 Tax=Gehongia tenuis TaxID=2763655 RepID=A0A926D4U4_9FIRM|nr:SIMPL domain-containing protein [Gehongia tenuis]MBC8531444.1 SIMPL domain-containing protein [Gehongia tenuis]
MMKKKVALSIAAMVIAVLALGGCGAEPGESASAMGGTSTPDPSPVVEPVNNKALEGNTTLSVRGEYTMYVDPDVGYATVGVVTTGKEAKAAQEENTQRMQAVMEAAKAAGIAEEDIQTSNVSIYPNYGSNGRDIVGYEVRNTVELKIRDTGKVGEALDACLGAGANTVDSVWFGLDEKEEHYNTALQNALKNARTKADALTESTGQTIYETLSVVEDGASYVPQYTDYRIAKETAYDGAGAITPSQVQVDAAVTVTYTVR